MVNKLKIVAEELRKIASEKEKLDSQQVLNFLKFYVRPKNEK